MVINIFTEIGDERNILTSASGHMLNILGKAQITIKIREMILSYTFLVIEQLSQNIILDLDFLELYSAKIDYFKEVITFCDELIMSNYCVVNAGTQNTVRTIRDIQLLPRSEALFEGRCSKDFVHSSVAIFEPVPHQWRTKYWLAKAIVQPRHKTCVTRILNPTNQTIRIRRNTILGTFDIIDEGDIFSDKTDKSNPTQGKQNKNLWDLGIKIENENLIPNQKLELEEILNENIDLFPTGLSDIPGINLLQYVINTGDAESTRQHSYRYTPEYRREIERQVKEMLENDIIE